jgi:site-specific DNA-methyltransferase (adenine-specific)
MPEDMMQRAITRNTLFYGDNLAILREYIPDESVDLIYLDPPFNSNRSYNVLFKEESGSEAEAQITAFDDAWHWGEMADKTYRELVTQSPQRVEQMIGALREFIGANQMMAYLVMMAARLVELHRVLKPTGSLYLHCDPTASHYLKIILDILFGPERFLSEVIWQRTATKGDVRRKFGAVHDVILAHTKTNNKFQSVFSLPDEAYHERFRFDDGDGRGPYQSAPLDSPNPRPNLTYKYKGYEPPPKGWRVSLAVMEQLDREGRIRRKVYLSDQAGPKVQDVWTDISPLQGAAAERLGYPTQKPLALLECIINASSNPGDIVLEPFCGCGTAIVAAQKLGRRWVGIDITHLSIALQKYRLKDMFQLEAKKDYVVVGEPEDFSSAQQLAEDDRYQFQWWALSLVKARPVGSPSPSQGEGRGVGKKGKDEGIDGVITFIDDTTDKPKRALVQVKSGHIKAGDLRDLRGTVERENAALGVFVTLHAPSEAMKKEAVAAGYYHSPGWNQDYPRLQILTVSDLLAGSACKCRRQASPSSKRKRSSPSRRRSKAN